MAIRFSTEGGVGTADDTVTEHIRRWLDSLPDFQIEHSIDALEDDGVPNPALRLPQLTAAAGAATAPGAEWFDLSGRRVSDGEVVGAMLLVECERNRYGCDRMRNYEEFLTVCYSGFVRARIESGTDPDIEFMWVVGRPLSCVSQTALTTTACIRRACDRNADRLGCVTFDESLAARLAPRLWLAVHETRAAAPA